MQELEKSVNALNGLSSFLQKGRLNLDFLSL